MSRTMLRWFCLSISMGSMGLFGAGATAHAAAKATPEAPVAAASPKKVRAVRAQAQYSARVTSATPMGVFLLIDQSNSNFRPITGMDVPIKRAEALTRAANANIEAIVASGMNGVDSDYPDRPKFKPWFHVAALGYSSGVPNKPDVRGLIGKDIRMHSLAELYDQVKWLNHDLQPARNDEEFARMSWIESFHHGHTPMGEGFEALIPLASQFVKEHPDSPAPIVMHFTDGKPEYGKLQHEAMAKKLRSIGTSDGKLLLFNIHVGDQGTFMFPNQETIDGISSELRTDAQLLFDMSSKLPPRMLDRARLMFPDLKIPDGARAMVYNATGDILGRLLDMGTVQNMKDRN